MQRSLHLAHQFTRRVAFGLPHDAALPDDPLAWAKAQLKRVPPMDILERDGTRRTDLPTWVQLLWRMDDVMQAFEKHRRLEVESFDKAKRMSKEQYEAERKRDIGTPYWQMEHWKEVQARATTALYGEAPVFERFWHFWSNHFMVAPGNQNNDTLVGPFQRSLREKMTGDFQTLLWHATTHPSMLVYLDNNNNTGPRSRAAREKWTTHSINENLGRELLELFTLSPDSGYTQKDVEAVTLILTGWRDMRPDKHHKAGVPLGTFFDFNYHEPGSQVVMGKTYSALFRPSAKLEDLIADLAVHPATARHLARKLCVYFLDDDPPAAAIRHVEQVFLQTKGHLPAVHDAVLEMCWAHLETTRKFLSPETWLLQTWNLMGVGPPRTAPLDERGGLKTHHVLSDLGQPLPRCPQPNGWPIRSVDWISKEMLDRRVRFMSVVTRDWLQQAAQPRQTLNQLCEKHFAPDNPELALIQNVMAKGDVRSAHTLFHASPTLLWS